MLVSIIIPMYNREKTIKMAVESILEQTCQDFELIIVDDCSTDRSVEIVKNIDIDINKRTIFLDVDDVLLDSSVAVIDILN